MVLEGQVCYSLPLLSPVHAGHREGQRGLRMPVYPTCVSFTCGIPYTCAFHSLCPRGPVYIRPLSNWILLGCKSILHESWTTVLSDKSTMKAPFLATSVACGWPQRNVRLQR